MVLKNRLLKKPTFWRPIFLFQSFVPEREKELEGEKKQWRSLLFSVFFLFLSSY